MDLALWFEISRRFEYRLIDEDIACAHTHLAAKTTADRSLMFGELAVLLSTQTGGFPIGRQLVFDLIKGNLVADQSLCRRAGRFAGRVARKLRLVSAAHAPG
jgi:hypothetical protein